jgi:hypothetical protein
VTSVLAGKLAALGKQLEAAAAQLTVTTGIPDVHLLVFGAARVDAIASTARPLAPGTPLLLTPDSLFDLRQNTFDLHARSSFVGGIVKGPRIGNFETGAFFLTFFYNDNIILDRYGLLPYELWGELKNDDWRFGFGLHHDLFGPLDPNLLTFGLLFGSGNTGNYRGEIRAERFLYPHENVQVFLQAAISEPISTLVIQDVTLTEDNGFPNVEGRVALGLGPLDQTGLLPRRPLVVGLSGVGGQVRNTRVGQGRQVVGNVWGVNADLDWRIGDFGIRGEAYAGQGLGTYNGAILQTVNNITFETVRSGGGWLETYYYILPDLHAHTGFGIDDAVDRDVIAGPIRNETYFANIVWEVSRNFRVGFEFTYRETAYRGPAELDNEGTTYHTQFQFLF